MNTKFEGIRYLLSNSAEIKSSFARGELCHCKEKLEVDTT